MWSSVRRAERRFARAVGSQRVTDEYRSDRRQLEFCPAAVTAGQSCSSRCPLPGGARDVGGDDVGGVPVQAAAGPVVPDRGPRVGVRGSLLHVPQRHSGIQTGREQCSNHAEYLSRSRAPGGYSWVGDYGYASPRPWSRAGSGASTGRRLRRVPGHVRGMAARRRAAWLTGELAAAGTSVSGRGDA